MTNALMNFEGLNVEVFEHEGKVLFNPRHVGEALGMSEVTVRRHMQEMNENKRVSLTNSNVHSMNIRKLANRGETFITESGVYDLIFKSRKPEAIRFKDWVTDEVLPQIRKTGGYIPVNQEESNEEFLARAFLIAQETLKKKDELIAQKEQKLIEQKPKVDYYDKVLNSDTLLTTTAIAKDIGISATKLNNFLYEQNIVYPKSIYNGSGYTKSWFPYAKYQFLITEGYADYHIHDFGQTLKWTEKGRHWILDKYKTLKTV